MSTPPPKPRSLSTSPSYASPTQSSKRREVDRHSSREMAGPKKLIQARDFIRWEVFRSFTVSTTASRRKNRKSGHFRFFDLPPEIRDRIYEIASAHWTNTKLDMNRYCFETVEKARQIQPALLRTSKRLRDEAGVHFFSCRTFDILVNREDVRYFLNWFKSLGKLNRERLASNPQVTIRLVQPRDQCRKECGHERPFGTNSLYGVEVLKETELTAAYESIVTPVTLALGVWSFTTECPGTIYSWHERPSPFRITQPRPSRQWDSRTIIAVSLPTLVRMRTMVKGMFAILEDREVVLMDEHDRRGRWLHAVVCGRGFYVTRKLDGEGATERSIRIHVIV